MKLLSLQLCNFRQFYGETPKVRFGEGDKNVTIIHGANGAGKTTLLNAITWVLFGKFTAAFAAPEFLVNKRALREAKVNDRVDCWAELMFEHSGRKYVVKRSQPVIKTKHPDGHEADPARVTLMMAAEDGRWQSRRDEDIPDIIGRILPEKLFPYFFFDGERIESLQRSSRQPDVISATTMLVGEEVIARAIDHLDGARKKIEAELKQIGDSETTELLDRKSEVESQIAEKQEALKRWDLNLDGYRKEKRAVEDALRELKSVQELQKRRDQLTAQEKELESSLSMARTELAQVVSAKGYQAYLKPAVGHFREIISGLRKKGELPSSIKVTFVQALLEDKRCICDRPLIPGEHPHREVQKWLDRGGMTDVEEVALRMEAEVDALERELPQFFARVDQLQQGRAVTREKWSRLQADLEAIRDELSSSPEQSARDLENRRTAIDDAMEKTQRRQIEDSQEINRLNVALESLKREIQRREGVTAAQQQTKRRLTASYEAIKTLNAVRSRLRTNFRMDLNDRINHLFSRMSYKPYRAVLDEGYCLSLVDGPGDTVVGAGTGESALLSLAFIGAVIDQARDLTARRDRLPGPDSSVFPVVMDSPFGNLDPVYRKQVAKTIPELAYQVTVLASKSQFQGEVENTVHGRIGREYVLLYNSPKQDSPVDRLERGGVVYDLVRHTPDENEWTEIVEVTRVG